MKKITRKILCAAMIVCMMLSLCACKADPFCGYYEASSVEIGDMSFPIEEAYENGASLELKNASLCTLKLNGIAYEGEWKSEGSKVIVTIEEETSNGTVENGVLSIDLYGTGMTMVCNKK